MKCSVTFLQAYCEVWPSRLSRHQSSNQRTCEVAVHFNKEKRQLSDFEFIVIEQICNIDDNHNVNKRLLTREEFWCSQLCTLQTYGISCSVIADVLFGLSIHRLLVCTFLLLFKVSPQSLGLCYVNPFDLIQRTRLGNLLCFVNDITSVLPDFFIILFFPLFLSFYL